MSVFYSIKARLGGRGQTFKGIQIWWGKVDWNGKKLYQKFGKDEIRLVNAKIDDFYAVRTTLGHPHFPCSKSL